MTTDWLVTADLNVGQIIHRIVPAHSPQQAEQFMRDTFPGAFVLDSRRAHRGETTANTNTPKEES